MEIFSYGGLNVQWCLARMCFAKLKDIPKIKYTKKLFSPAALNKNLPKTLLLALKHALNK